jgi:hypothetical protein
MSSVCKSIRAHAPVTHSAFTLSTIMLDGSRGGGGCVGLNLNATDEPAGIIYRRLIVEGFGRAGAGRARGPSEERVRMGGGCLPDWD